MAFDPTVPAVNANLDANPIRDNFNALKGLIDAIPGPQSGLAMLDGLGVVNISTVGSPVALVASPANIGGGMSGTVRVQPLGGNSWNIESTAGAADAGWQVFWIAF